MSSCSLDPTSAAAAAAAGTSAGAVSFVDTHVHLDQILRREKSRLTSFGEFESHTLLRPAVVDNVMSTYDGCVHVCCDKKAFQDSEYLINTFPHVWGAFGIHPHNAKDYDDDVEASLVAFMSNPKTVAWGEMGLDYHYNHSEPAVQREVFARQLRQAVQCAKPLVIHTRSVPVTAACPN